MTDSNGVTTSIPKKSAAMAVVSPELDTDKLAAWIADKADAKRGKWRCVHFSLCRLTESGGFDQAITQEGLDPKLKEPERTERIAAIVKEFDHASRGWANESQYKATFVVGGCLTDDEGEFSKYQFPFKVSPSHDALVSTGDEFGASVTSIGPKTDMSAVVGGLYRILDTQIEVQSRTTLAHQEQLASLFKHSNEERERVLGRLSELTMAMQESLDRQNLRNMEVMEKKFDLEQREEIHKMVREVLLPMGARALEAKGILPPGSFAGDNPVLSLMKTFTPEQFVAFWGNLDEEQKKQAEPMARGLMSSMPKPQQDQIWKMFAAAAGPSTEQVPVTVTKQEDKS